MKFDQRRPEEDMISEDEIMHIDINKYSYKWPTVEFIVKHANKYYVESIN